MNNILQDKIKQYEQSFINMKRNQKLFEIMKKKMTNCYHGKYCYSSCKFADFNIFSLISYYCDFFNTELSLTKNKIKISKDSNVKTEMIIRCKDCVEIFGE